MCLAVPGRVIEIKQADPDDPAGALASAGVGKVASVDFQGSRIEVSLAMTPEADVGDWVLVHAGFALTVLDEADARETWEYLTMAQVAAPADGAGPGEADDR